MNRPVGGEGRDGQRRQIRILLYQLWIRDGHRLHECFVLFEHPPAVVRQAPGFMSVGHNGLASKLICGSAASGERSGHGEPSRGGSFGALQWPKSPPRSLTRINRG